MRVGLDPGDRILVIFSGALLVAVSVAGMLLAPGRTMGLPGIPSTYSTASTGAKAAYLLLEELRYKQERWSSPPTELPENAQHIVLILADPLMPASSEEKTALQWFVRRGGRVVATGNLAAPLLGLYGIVSGSEPVALWKEFYPQLPGPISYLAPSVDMKTNTRWQGDRPGDLKYYGDSKGGTVVRFRLGSGIIIWWADSSPLTNYGLTQASNLNLLLNSVGRPQGVRILWDEYYHGERPGLWSYLGKTPLGWALLQMALLAIAILFTYSRRSGPVASPVEESRLSPIEFVETVGDLYARKRAARGALEIALHRFRSLFARRLGFPPEGDLEKAHAVRLEQREELDSGLRAVLSECEQALKSGTAHEAQSLMLVQELHDHTRRLRLAGKGD